VEFLNVIILLGALQGFIISALLLSGKDNLVHQKLLAFLILIISLACLNLYLLEINLPGKSRFWFEVGIVVPLILAMPLGPLIFFYVKSLMVPGFTQERKDRIHFYPVLLDLIPRMIGAIYVMGESSGLISVEDGNFLINLMNQCDTYFDIPRWISVSAYLGWSWREVQVYTSKADARNLRWAKKFLTGFTIFQAIWLLHLIPYAIPSFSEEWIRIVNWYPVYIPLAFMVYWLGINGFLLRTEAKRENRKGNLFSEDEVEKIKTKLLVSMEQDRLYLDPDLNLNSLVMHTGIPQKAISAVLNQKIGKSFNEFVNEYRIREVKQRLQQGALSLTIAGIAFECGFNSQATFQRAFKQAAGQTPSEYLSEVTNASKISAQI